MLGDVIDAQGPDQTKLLQAFEPQGSEALGLLHVRCGGTPALSGVSDRHTIILSRTGSVGLACSIGRESLNHTAMVGNVTTVPADVDWTANAGGTLDHIVVSIPRASFAVAAARADRPALTIVPQIRGRDRMLQAIVDELIEQSVSPTEPGAGWHDLTIELLDHLADTYGVGVKCRQRGILTATDMGRINSYLEPRLEKTVAVDDLAAVVAQSPSHFPRVFRRTVGLSPHQYILRLRLRRARELIHTGLSLAEAALGSGFADQSHLSYWVRRFHGTTPRRWGASRA